MKHIASLRDHALNLRRALWKSMICFRVVDHDVEQNHRIWSGFRSTDRHLRQDPLLVPTPAAVARVEHYCPQVGAASFVKRLPGSFGSPWFSGSCRQGAISSSIGSTFRGLE